MAFRFERESGGYGDDLTWLDSKRGVDTARTGTVRAASLTGYEVGDKVPSGIAVSLNSDHSYNVATDVDQVVGFLLTDHIFYGDDLPVAIIDHGRIRAARLPEQAIDARDLHSPHFIVVDGNPAPAAPDNGDNNGEEG